MPKNLQDEPSEQFFGVSVPLRTWNSYYKKMRFYLILIAALFLSSTFSSNSWGFTVIIDPGHGGADVGANHRGVKESEITLKVAKKLHQRIQRSEEMNSQITRTRDVTLGLDDRVEFAERHKGDVFLSIHVNSNKDQRAKGAEFYFQNQLEPNEAAAYLAHQESQLGGVHASMTNHPLVSPHWGSTLKTIFLDLVQQARVKKSFLLAKALRETWGGTKKSKTHSLKQAPFRVVSQTQIPATLVELGFLTNRRDYRALNDDAYLDQVVESLYQGLLKYKSEATEDTVAKTP